MRGKRKQTRHAGQRNADHRPFLRRLTPSLNSETLFVKFKKNLNPINL